jgi:hypothetical protein
LIKAITNSEVRGRLCDEEAEIDATTPEQLAMFVRKEMDKCAEAVKISGAKRD